MNLTIGSDLNMWLMDLFQMEVGVSVNTLNEIDYFHFDNADQNYELEPDWLRKT